MADETNETSLLNELNDSKSPELVNLVTGDPEVPIFFAKWLESGCNATAAYKALHPNVADASARVLGCKKLTLINKPAILAAYGLEFDTFFDQLKSGLQAEKFNEFSGEKVADHKIRLEYLRLLGRLLGIIQE